MIKTGLILLSFLCVPFSYGGEDNIFYDPNLDNSIIMGSNETIVILEASLKDTDDSDELRDFYNKMKVILELEELLQDSGMIEVKISLSIHY